MSTPSLVFQNHKVPMSNVRYQLVKGAHYFAWVPSRCWSACQELLFSRYFYIVASIIISGLTNIYLRKSNPKWTQQCCPSITMMKDSPQMTDECAEMERTSCLWNNLRKSNICIPYVCFHLLFMRCYTNFLYWIVCSLSLPSIDITHLFQSLASRWKVIFPLIYPE